MNQLTLTILFFVFTLIMLLAMVMAIFPKVKILTKGVRGQAKIEKIERIDPELTNNKPGMARQYTYGSEYFWLAYTGKRGKEKTSCSAVKGYSVGDSVEIAYLDDLPEYVIMVKEGKKEVATLIMVSLIFVYLIVMLSIILLKSFS